MCSKGEMYTGSEGRTFSSSVLLFLCIFLICGCTASKQIQGNRESVKTIQNEKDSVFEDQFDSGGFSEIVTIDDHMSISSQIKEDAPLLKEIDDALLNSNGDEKEKSLDQGLDSGTESSSGSAVANQIVENYFQSKNKEPGGHCLHVSKRRFEKAYEDIYGHSFYKDLPDSMARASYSPREVFDFLYFSTSGAHEGWQSLPVQYRGKGNAGALAFAGMGTLVDWFGIWSGKLRPGAPMQVWKHRDDYELVVKGERTEDFDPFGHSFIFVGYVRDEKNNITGIRIADQGYQSYRPLLPRDYEVWWAVNLSI